MFRGFPNMCGRYRRRSDKRRIAELFAASVGLEELYVEADDDAAPGSMQDGIDIRTLQGWMGHRDSASTMIYLKGVRNSDIQARLNGGSLAAFA
jgi:hypothetical protein